MKKYEILIISIVAIALMSIVEVVIEASYMIKSLAKILCFLIIPIIIARRKKEISIKSFLKFSKKSIKKALLLGVIIYLIILGGYLVVLQLV